MVFVGWFLSCVSVVLTLQEFDVNPSRTVREEFYSVYQRQLAIVSEQERISKELETVGTDMDKMQVSQLMTSGALLSLCMEELDQ